MSQPLPWMLVRFIISLIFFMLLACQGSSGITFVYEVKISLRLAGSKFDSKFDIDGCRVSHAEMLAKRVANMAVCKFNTFTVVDVKYKETSFFTDDARFTLKVDLSEGNRTALEQCAETINNSKHRLFGPISPSTNKTGSYCLDPWIVESNKTSIVNPKYFSCKGNAHVVSNDGLNICFELKPVQQVAFSVQLAQDQAMKAHQRIVYDKVLTNVGDGYDSKTGVFTCPVAGLYVFHIHALTRYNQKMKLELHHNSQYVVNLYGHNDTHESGSNTAILHLEVGDKVDVVSFYEAKLPGGPNRCYSTFSGYLITRSYIPQYTV